MGLYFHAEAILGARIENTDNLLVDEETFYDNYSQIGNYPDGDTATWITLIQHRAEKYDANWQGALLPPITPEQRAEIVAEAARIGVSISEPGWYFVGHQS